MRLRVVFLLGVAMMSAPSTRAYYTPIMLAETIARADLIVVGQIRSVNGTQLRFAATEILKGYADTSFPLRIQTFTDWSCASRWTPYRSGQRLVLFLEWTPDGAGVSSLRIVGAGDEGEAPIQGDRVYFQAPEERVEEHQVFGAAFYGASAPLSSLTDAVRQYGRMFEWSFPFRDWPSIRQVGSDADVRAFRSRTDLHRRLVRQTVEYRTLMANW
jgi:hypothetical protein